MLSFPALARMATCLATIGLGMIAVGCRPTHYALIQHERVAHSRLPAERQEAGLIAADTLPGTAQPAQASPAVVAVAPSANEGPANPMAYHPKAHHVRNPEAREPKRAAWLREWSVKSNPTVTEFAPRHEVPVPTAKRRVPGLAKASVVGGILSQGLVLFGTASGFVWVLAIMVPLASILLGVAGLAKLTRRRDEFRGKGWAMSGILLATGAIGLALMAAAALATSEVIWK
ncbi:hypothetical protein F5984_09060 [Rudanella paleaurantiibacter]|uniref:DUF4190 domain-containing protein n=1 Tax=Rudanella paleaurantiibacter TaxID=2614655 RepID=A0A7J5U0B5_9BACT|nr:hypothetical protein [Rudanella paleaurantiibacter]KAB7730971.1 hypothetical protein F5984_09060 [Rudanella paleaurantiibacter]